MLAARHIFARPAGVSGPCAILRIETALGSMRWPLRAGLTAPGPTWPWKIGNDRDRS